MKMTLTLKQLKILYVAIKCLVINMAINLFYEESHIFVVEDVGPLVVLLLVVGVGHANHLDTGPEVPENKMFRLS